MASASVISSRPVTERDQRLKSTRAGSTSSRRAPRAVKPSGRDISSCSCSSVFIFLLWLLLRLATRAQLLFIRNEFTGRIHASLLIETRGASRVLSVYPQTDGRGAPFVEFSK